MLHLEAQLATLIAAGGHGHGQAVQSVEQVSAEELAGLDEIMADELVSCVLWLGGMGMSYWAMLGSLWFV